MSEKEMKQEGNIFFNLVKFHFVEILQILSDFATFAIFLLRIHENLIAAVQKYANLVEFEKCCQTHIFLQYFVLIQPRTSPPKKLTYY